MEKKIIITIVGLVMIILLTFGGSKGIGALTKSSDMPNTSTNAPEKSNLLSVTIGNEGIKENANDWNTFVQDTKSKIKSSIQIKYQYVGTQHANRKDGTFYDEVNLRFDGESYYVSTEKYKYLLELTGRNNNAAHDSTYVILSNKEYSFKEVSNSLYSSNSNDHIPYKLLYCHY